MNDDQQMIIKCSSSLRAWLVVTAVKDERHQVLQNRVEFHSLLTYHRSSLRRQTREREREKRIEIHLVSLAFE